MLSIALAIFFLVVAYILFEKYFGNGDDQRETLENKAIPIASGTESEEYGGGGQSKVVADEVPDSTVKETVYTMDYYPWWRSTRWWNYDGWLYQKPYYNYWRRPYYYNYWYSGRPLIIGGKRYYKRNFW